MRFRNLNEENLKTIYPNTGIKLQELVQEEKKEYIEQYNIYRSLFVEFIIEKLDLKNYDEELEKSELRYLSSNIENMDLYQYFSSDELKFFYIRNNMYIEKLTEEERNWLNERIKNKNYELDNEAKEFIEDTYEKVIFEDVLRDGSKCITLFGPDSSNYLAKNDAIVIGINYDEFNLNGLNDDEWSELYFKQSANLYSIIEKMRSEMKNKIDIPVEVLKYNMFSIKRRN